MKNNRFALIEGYYQTCIELAHSDRIEEWKRQYFETQAKYFAKISQQKFVFDDEEVENEYI